MNDNIKNAIKFYVLCNKLKDLIRKGPLTWNVNRERIESVAEHIYGVQMLAISIYYQFNYKLDLNKVIYMLLKFQTIYAIIDNVKEGIV